MVAPTGRETFELVAEGASLTTGNTLLAGYGTPGSKVGLGSAAIRGVRGARFSGTDVSAFGFLTFTAVSTASAECYFKYRTANRPTGGSGGMTFLQIRDSTGGRLSVVWLNTGILSVLNAAGSSIRNLNTNTELADGNYRLQITAVVGTTTTNGRALVRLNNATTGAVIDNWDSGTAVNTGLVNYSEIRWGKTGQPGVGVIELDDLAWLYSSTQAIDLTAANQAPTCDAGADQVGGEPYTPFSLDFSRSSDPEGSALTYSVTQISGTTTALSGSGATRTGVIPGTLAGTTLEYSVTANDGVNTSAADTVSVQVLPATEFAAVGGVLVPSRLTLATS